MRMPLEGVRILDLSAIIAGPYSTLLLADLGAEVIKIEKPGTGDGARGMPPHYVEGESAYFIAYNRNKKSLVLNLTKPQGKKAFLDLVKISDVVVNNYRPGVIEKLGLHYEALRELNPRIICCSITGYGSTGPFKDRPAFDICVQARGGIMSFTGEPGRPPVRQGVPMGDLGGGIFAAHGILAALYQREKTGRGQKIDISMLDCQIAMLSYRGQYYLSGGEIAQPLGTGHASVHPSRSFQTKTFEIVLDCNLQRIFDEFCALAGVPEMAKDPRFSSRENRFTHQKALYEKLEALFLTRTGEEWLALMDARIPIAPINTVDKALTDPQVLSRNMVPEVDCGAGKTLKIIGNPIKMSEIEKEKFTPAPRLDQDGDQLLRELLHYRDEEIKAAR
ncbi:MAG: CoA transferase [Deltaproteobacteria bacterium]|nr:CoA transferase [Deltaproteobacteria bacterium]